MTGPELNFLLNLIQHIQHHFWNCDADSSLNSARFADNGGANTQFLMKLYEIEW